MAVKIRLKKIGRTHYPSYRICVMDGRTPRGGKVVENIGSYDPHLDDAKKVTVDLERARYWISVGAQPSDTVRDILNRAGLNAPAGNGPETSPVKTAAGVAEIA